MIKILQTEPFAYHAYEEYKNKGKIDWDLYQKFDPLEFCKSYSNSMYLYKPETMKNIIKDGYIHKELQIDIVKEIADCLISQNCLIFVLCPKFEDISESEYETEQWYQTKYVMTPIPEEFLVKLNNPIIDSELDHKLAYPEPNLFFPSNLDLIPDDDPYDEPQLIYNSSESQVWYLKDAKFHTRYIMACEYLYFKDDHFNTTVEGKVFINIWIDVLNFYLKEFLYTSQYANATFGWTNMNGGLQFNFTCYRDKFEEFISKCYDKIRNIDYSKQNKNFESK